MHSSLTFRAGPGAFKLIRERGLRAEDVDIMAGASGGAKWLSIGGLDRFVFGTTPWITIGLMFLAFIAACVQVVRSNTNSAQ